mgnify:CR=1 FL=1
MRPKFCPHCGARLDDPNGAYSTTTTGPSPKTGWDCFCDRCSWSGDIFPDFQTEADLYKALLESVEETL